MPVSPFPPSTIESGSPHPLGASYNGAGTNFAVFSANAHKIEVCLFDPSGRHEIARYALPENTNDIWHGYLPGVHAGALYGYRAYGPYQPERGHRFNPNKLLIDPYAKSLFGKVRWSDTLYGYRYQSQRSDLSFDRRDSAAAVPKCVVTDTAFDWHGDKPPGTLWRKTIIYEAHVKGMTMRAEHIPPNQRGTFAALADPYIIEHLVKLGITALELLPVHAILQDRRLQNLGLRNYWGYNSLSFFAPEAAYLSSGSANEMRHAIRQLHEAGIEVILDVVYNHTCEEGETGPTLCWRGLDNAIYYRHHTDSSRHIVNDTGCGNTLNMSHPRVIQMVMDSLRHWVQEYHVDGFRFDLCSTLGRERLGYDRGAGFFDALMQDPVLSRVKLISEPWDLGPGGYQLGNHPVGFAEWNDRFRDDTRKFWKGDAGLRPHIASRLLGSADHFNHHRRRAWASINFVTAHDGFTLQDLVSYHNKYNEANREHNRDGTNANESHNWGAEGPTTSAEVVARRERVKRAMLMTLFFSNGTPMLLGGDEFGRTQQGNNNAYCQDNEISWFDWNLADTPAGKALIEFTRRCITVRRERPVLTNGDFFTARPKVWRSVPDTSWFDETGNEMMQESWNYAEGRLLALRRITHSEETVRRGKGGVAASLLLLNASGEDREFILPPPEMPWEVAIDASSPDGAPTRHPKRHRISVPAHCALLLVADNVLL